MFRAMRNHKKEVSQEIIGDILEKGEYGILSTVGDHGYPCMTPMNYVYYNNCIYLHCAMEGERLDNIRRNNKVTFAVVSDTKILPKLFTTNYKSVIAYGEAREVDENLRKEVLLEVIKKYSQDFLVTGEKYIKVSAHKTVVLEIKINHVTGKVSER